MRGSIDEVGLCLGCYSPGGERFIIAPGGPQLVGEWGPWVNPFSIPTVKISWVVLMCNKVL